jgi:signal transduction histidine kinase
LPPLEVDAGRVGQILENVVGNALKYSPADAVVRIEARVERGRLVVSVVDRGIGLPEAERSLVLEPFHRAANTRESSVPGSGLGLYIARRLVEAHGGRLVLGDGPDGNGTRVSFDLPLLERAPGPTRRRGR